MKAYLAYKYLSTEVCQTMCLSGVETGYRKMDCGGERRGKAGIGLKKSEKVRRIL